MTTIRPAWPACVTFALLTAAAFVLATYDAPSRLPPQSPTAQPNWQAVPAVDWEPAQVVQLSSGERQRLEEVHTLIATLDAESLEDSLANLDGVDQFMFPGHHAGTFTPRPIDHVLQVLSNRRVLKIFDELRPLPSRLQHDYLSRYFDHYLAQQRELLDLYGADSARRARLTADDPEAYDFTRAHDLESGPPGYHGTRYALQSIAVLAGMLQVDTMRSRLRTAFAHPQFGFDYDPSDDDRERVARLTNNSSQTFPPGLRAQVIHQMTRGRPGTVPLLPDDEVTVRFLYYPRYVTPRDIRTGPFSATTFVNGTRGGIEGALLRTDDDQMIEALLEKGL